MKTYRSDGVRLPIVAPANANAGDGVLVGNIFGVYENNAVAAANAIIVTEGVVGIRKLNGASSSFAQGANVHWDATNGNCTVSTTSNRKIGVAVAAAANADTTVDVMLTGKW